MYTNKILKIELNDYTFLFYFRVKNSPLKQSPGYQMELVIQLVWVGGEPPQQITSLAVNSSYGL